MPHSDGMNGSRELARIPMRAPGRWLLVHLSHLAGEPFLFLGRYLSAPRKNDPDRLDPTTECIRCDVQRIPALRAALEVVEAEALAAGLLSAEDYREAGLPVPPALERAA